MCTPELRISYANLDAMKKVLLQAFLALFLFFAVLYGFSRVDWMSVFRIDSASIEKRLGKAYWDLFSNTEEVIDSESVTVALDSLLTHLCRANGIDRDRIKLHVFRNEEVNAFAFPDRHLVIYSGLIGECRSESELCGVMAHELAHMQKGHVMRKLVKEIGLSTLIGVASGGNGADVLRQTARLLSSTAFDRSMESEADTVAVSYLKRACISPGGLADFLSRLSKEENLPEIAVWISTHPASGERSQKILQTAGGTNTTYRPVLSAKSWDTLKRSIGEK